MLNGAMLGPIESWLLFFASCFGAMWGSLITYRFLVELLWLRKTEPTTAHLNSLTTSRPIAFGEPSAALPDEGPQNILANYSYEVLGNRYRGAQVSILDSSLPLLTNHDKRLAAELQDAVSRDGRITAWYDPSRPSKSVLSRKKYMGRFVAYTLISALSWFGIATQWSAWSYAAVAATLLLALGAGGLLVSINRNRAFA